MEINAKTIAHLANLSRLHIADSQMEQYQQDLQKMVAFIEQLNELNTEGVAPLRMMSAAAEQREDRVQGSLSLEEAMHNAPASHPPYFTVPKVINK